jgi:hypothetical protein
LFRSVVFLLLRIGRTLRIRIGCTTTNLGMEIEASEDTFFKVVFEEFLLEDGRIRGKVQQPVEGTIFKVLISARSYSCTDCGMIF